MSAVALLGITAYDAVLDETVQKGLLVGSYAKALDNENSYRKNLAIEEFEGGNGNTFSKFRKGRLTAQRVPRGGAKTTSNDGGYTPETNKGEKYTWSLQRYGHTVDTEATGSATSFRNNLREDYENIGMNAGESLDLLTRLNYMMAYKAGVTFIDTTETGDQNSLELDNIYGFMMKMKNGVPTAVSGTNKLEVWINGVLNNVTGAAQDTATVTIDGDSVTVDAVRTTDDGLPGTITVETAVNAPQLGWEVRSKYAPQQIRPNGRKTEYQLAAGDTLTMAMVNSIVSGIIGRGGKQMDGDQGSGFYGYFCPEHRDQLWADPAFYSWYQGQGGTAGFKDMDISRAGNVIFDFTGRPAFRPHPDATKAAAGVYVRNALIVARDSLVEARSKDLLERPDMTPEISQTFVRVFDQKQYVEIILRSPNDRRGKIVSTTWEAILDWVATTDSLTKNGSVCPDADHKRGGLIQTV